MDISSGGAIAAAAGVLGAALSFVGTGMYLRDVGRGRTRPHRGSWLVWAVIAVLAAASHGAEGGSWSLAVLSGQALGTVLVLGAALIRGVGWFTPTNLIMLLLAALGILGWTSLTDPMAATACACLADGAGLVALLPKAWADPHSETLATYALAGATGLLAVIAVLAVEAWDPALLLFPAYFCLGNAGTAAFIARRRRHQQEATAIGWVAWRAPSGDRDAAPDVRLSVTITTGCRGSRD
jgi:hypothetical protein